MSAIQGHIRCLERYLAQSGARLVRARMPDLVHGGVSKGLITLQADLNPEQQLTTLVHELTHWLVHRDGLAAQGSCCTIYEYEAEAVEALVMARLGLPCPGYGPQEVDPAPPTDGLLSSSVARVISSTREICLALGLE
jgi:hypothetical protein